MKKAIFTLGLSVVTLNVLIAQSSSPCTPNTETTFIAYESQAFSQTITIVVPTRADSLISSFPPAPIDSMDVNGVNGLPAGINWQSKCGTNLCRYFLPLKPGDIIFSGTPTTIGTYTVTIGTFVYVNLGIGPTPTQVDFKYLINVLPTSQQHALITSYRSISVSSASACNGLASVTATKGTAPYSYKWTNGETTNAINNQCTANYNVTVTDFSGTKDTLTIFIADSSYIPPTPPTPCTVVCPDTFTTFIATESQLFSETIRVLVDTSNFLSPFGQLMNIGSLDSLSVDNVTGLPDGVSWRTICGLSSACNYLPLTTAEILLSGTPLTVGTYTVSIQSRIYIDSADNSGTTTTGEFKYIISVFPKTQTHELITSFSNQNVSSFGLCDGSASISVTKGTPPYTYKWSSGATSSSISGKCSDKYVVNVSDSQGLKDSVDLYISEPSYYAINNPTLFFVPISDTLITNYDTCIIDYSSPIDSAFATDFTMLDSTHLSIDYAIYQGGQKTTFNALFRFDTVGYNEVNLVLNCKGTFTKMLKYITITQVVNLQYNQIGTTQNVNQNMLSLNIEELNTNQKVMVYPNPFPSQTTITIAKEVKNASVNILDVLGRVVKTINFSGTQVILEKGELTSGIYFVQVLVNKVLFATVKVVVQ